MLLSNFSLEKLIFSGVSAWGVHGRKSSQGTPPNTTAQLSHSGGKSNNSYKFIQFAFFANFLQTKGCESSKIWLCTHITNAKQLDIWSKHAKSVLQQRSTWRAAEGWWKDLKYSSEVLNAAAIQWTKCCFCLETSYIYYYIQTTKELLSKKLGPIWAVQCALPVWYN